MSAIIFCLILEMGSVFGQNLLHLSANKASLLAKIGRSIKVSNMFVLLMTFFSSSKLIKN
jgi:hypothetical protein